MSFYFKDGFENWAGGMPLSWGKLSDGTVTKEETDIHGGSYAVKLEGTNPSAPDFWWMVSSELIPDTTPYRGKKLIIKVWGKTNVDDGLVIGLVDDTGGLLYISWNNSVDYQEKIQEITIPQNASGLLHIQVFSWAQGTLESYLDDLEISIELFELDINNDFRNAIEVISDINNRFNTHKLELEDIENKFNLSSSKLFDITNKFNSAIGNVEDIKNKFHSKCLKYLDIQNDFRIIATWQIPGDAGIQPLGKTAFTVKINGVDKTDILDLDSLSWRETLNSSSTASFVLAIPYDSLSCPSENQTVEILFNDNRKFYGYITNIDKTSNPEGVTIIAESEYWNLNKTEVDFKVGRKITGDPTLYYTTINEALGACGFDRGIGNFTPVTMDLVGSKADVISQLVQESGNFSWFIKADGTKHLWQAGKGDIINLEKQVIGQNLGLYQAIEHNILQDSSGVVNKFKVIMGEDIVPGYNNEFRFVYIWQKYTQYNSVWMDLHRDNEPFSKFYRWHVSSAQWYDRRRDASGSAYEAIINIPGIGDNFKITVPSGMRPGYPIKYYVRDPTRYEWLYLGITYIPAFYGSAQRDLLSENTKVSYSWAIFYNRGGIYPEARRERTFEVTMGVYPQIITKDLVLSNLNVQYGTNYKTWEGHSWSDSEEKEDWDEFGWWHYPPKKLEEPMRWTVDRTGGWIAEKSFKISSWNDIDYAQDYAKWQLSKVCDVKEKGTIKITMDCADFYGLDLSKRINIDGITSNPLNIIAIDYNVGSYSVTIEVESSRFYQRSVSIPVHVREE